MLGLSAPGMSVDRDCIEGGSLGVLFAKPIDGRSKTSTTVFDRANSLVENQLEPVASSFLASASRRLLLHTIFASL